MLMPRHIITETIKTIEGVAIFVDLAALPDTVAKARSTIRHRMHAASAVHHQARATKLHGKRSKAVLDPPHSTDDWAATALQSRYIGSVEEQRADLERYIKAHAAKAAEREQARLTLLTNFLRAMAIVEKMSDHDELRGRLQQCIDAVV